MALAARLYDASFDPTTGSQGTTTNVSTYRIAEPVASNVAAHSDDFKRAVINSVSVEFRPNISLTNS